MLTGGPRSPGAVAPCRTDVPEVPGSVTRLAEDRFYIITAAGTETHDLDWIERHAPSDGSVAVENVTARWGVLMLAGPRSRDLLAPLTDTDLSNDAFPFMAVRDVLVGSVPVRALRVTYTGELGWELHHPIEYSRTLYDLLTEAGTAVGLADIGYLALDSLRLEKGYRLWGVDITSKYTPLEAGLERFVRFDKGDFIGRDALVRQRDEGITQTLACLTIDLDPADTLFPRGGEPVLSRNQLVGYLRAAHPGHAVGATIGLAYLPIASPPSELASRSRSSANGAASRSSRPRCTTRREGGCADRCRTEPPTNEG